MSETLRSRISGIVLFAVALVWIVLVYQTIAPGQGGEVGPRAFPLFFGYVLAGLSLLLLLQSFRPAVPELDNDADAPTVLPGELAAVVMTIASFIVYGMLLEPFGFIPSTAFVVAALLLLVLRVRSLFVIAGMAIGLSLGCYLVFGKLLGVYLPPGSIITIYL
jgi:putative tricarboxylic transport membrane protein